jgi:hypothetical protein
MVVTGWNGDRRINNQPEREMGGCGRKMDNAWHGLEKISAAWRWHLRSARRLRAAAWRASGAAQRAALYRASRRAAGSLMVSVIR